MATIRFVLKRLAAQRLLGLAMVVTLAFSVGVLVAGPLYADASREAILSTDLHSASVVTKNLRFTAFGAGDFPYRRADRDVHEAVTQLPVATLIRQGRSSVKLASGKRQITLPLLFRDGAGSRLDIRGQAPVGPGEILLEEFFAEELHLGIGDTFYAVGPSGSRVPLRLTGTYLPPNTLRANEQQSFWYGALNPFPPPDSLEPYPAFVDRAGYLDLSKRFAFTSNYVWDVYLDTAHLTFQVADQLPAQISQIGFPDESPLAGSRPLNGLQGVMDVVEQRVANLRVPVYLVVFQIGAVALAVLAGVASLALSRQAFELAVLRSRGFTRGKLLAAQAAQTIVTALIGYPVGLLLGFELARLATHANGPPPPGTRFPIHISGSALVAGAIGAVAAAILLLLMSLPAISRTIVDERRQLSRESRPLLARFPVEVILLPLGIAAFYEVKTRGFLPVNQTGSLDPLVVLAPTLLLFAASFLVLRLLLFGLRVLERPIGAMRSLPLYLAARRLARSPGTSFAISLLLVLSVGLLVVSTSYRATVIRNHEDSAHQSLGADWQVLVGSPEQPVAAMSDLPDSTTPILRTEPDVPQPLSYPPTALGIDLETYPSGGWWRSDYSTLSEGEILSGLATPDPSEPLPSGTTALQVSFRASAVGKKRLEGLGLAAVLERPDGSTSVAKFGSLAAGQGAVTAPVDGARSILSVVVVEPVGAQAPDSIHLRLDMSSVAGSTSPLDLSTWKPLVWRGSSQKMRPAGQGLDLTLRPGFGTVLGGVVPDGPPIPMLASPALASPGSDLTATLGGQRFTFHSIGTSRGFPSVTGDFMVVSLRPLLLDFARIPEPSLAVNEAWAMGQDDPRPALRAAGFRPGGTARAGRQIALLSQLPQSLAVGMHFTAASAGMALVVVGVGVGLYFTQRRREFEFASLRAMGSKRRQVSGVLVTEQGAMMGFAVVAGSLLGYAVVRLMMPYLGKSLGATFPAPVLVVDWRSLGIYAVAIGAGTVLGLVLALRAVLASSVTSVLRGEAE
jgi:hypothetical protein